MIQTSLQEMKCSASPQTVVLAGVRESKFLCRICDYSSEDKSLPSLWQKRTDVIKHQQMAGWLPWRMKPYQRLNIGESLLLLVNRKSMSLNHEPSSPTKWPLSKSWGSWRNRLLTSTEHVILSPSFVLCSKCPLVGIHKGHNLQSVGIESGPSTHLFPKLLCHPSSNPILSNPWPSKKNISNCPLVNVHLFLWSSSTPNITGNKTYSSKFCPLEGFSSSRD